MIRVLIVDDQTLIRQGIEVLLENEADIQVVGHASNGREALDLTEKLQPSIVLMDIRMPEMDGVEATAQITTRFPKVAVIILTTFSDDVYVFEGLKSGAFGYLLKDINSEEMAEAIRIVARGEVLIQPSVAKKVVAEFCRLAAEASPNQSALVDPLTERELEVLQLIADGLSNQEIADTLVIAVGTVKRHLTNIYEKLSVESRTQAIGRAIELNLIRQS